MNSENYPIKNMNRQLVEKMFEMRTKSYLYNVKSDILIQAVLGINESKKLLHQTNNAFSSLFNRLSHEIRTQLTSLIGTTTLLLLSKEGEGIPSHILEIQEKIRLVSKSILNITDNVNNFEPGNFREINTTEKLDCSTFYSDQLLKEALQELSHLDRDKIIISSENKVNNKVGLLCGDHLLLKNVLFYIGSIILDNLRSNDTLKIYFHITETKSITFHFDAKFKDEERAKILADLLNYKIGNGLFFLHSFISLANGVTSLTHSDSGFSYQIRFLLKQEILFTKKEYDRYFSKVGQTRQYNRPLVMYIDDNEISLAIYKAAIEKLRDFDAITCPSGKSGLAYLETELPNVILLDIRMPGMDGY